MVLRRRLVTRKGQVLVAVPREVQDQLSVSSGEAVYWQITHRGAAMLTRTSSRPAGRPIDPDLSRRCRELERTVKRLRGKLEARPVRIYNEGYNQGRMAHMGELVKLSVKLDDMREGAERVEREIAGLRSAMPLRRAPRRRIGNVVLPPGVVAVELPPPDVDPTDTTPPSPAE